MHDLKHPSVDCHAVWATAARGYEHGSGGFQNLTCRVGSDWVGSAEDVFKTGIGGPTTLIQP